MLCDSRAWTSNERVDLRPSSRLSDSLLEDSGDERTRYEETLIWTRSVEVPLVTLSLYNTSVFRVLLPMFKKVIPTVWMESEPHLQMDSAEKRTFLQPKVEKKDLI